jgi:hypothetical protein
MMVNGSRPTVWVELRRARRWRRALLAACGRCPRCGRWLRHEVTCPRWRA